MKRFLKQMALVACGAMTAMLLVMCGPPSMGMMGDAMVDVGMTLRDGSDTSMPDAMAQDCATSCTGGGVLRVMTADSDPERLVSETVRVPAWTGELTYNELVAGPVVVTDLEMPQEDGQTILVYVQDHPCSMRVVTDEQVVTLTTVPAGGAFSSDNRSIHGGRIFVPAGSHMCVVATSTTFFVYYAGFRPYD